MNARKYIKLITLSVLAVFALTTIVPAAAFAGSTGTRNTAIALTAGTIYAAMRGQKTAALALGAGSVLAWNKYTRQRKEESYQRGLRDGYYGRRGRSYDSHNRFGGCHGWSKQHNQAGKYARNNRHNSRSRDGRCYRSRR